MKKSDARRVIARIEGASALLAQALDILTTELTNGDVPAGDALAHVITQLEQLSIHIGEAYEIKGGRR